jgi:hypothetical protein
MGRYWLRLMLLGSPLVLWPVFELFVLPIDYFTFRPWEALITRSVSTEILGPFYPNQHLIKLSIGAYDAAREVANPRRQYEEWFTDANGFRNRPRPDQPDRYDVLLLGDSNIVGAFNTQDQILSEQLQRSCGCTVYNAAAAAPLVRTRDGRFVKNPPKAVVVNLGLPKDPTLLLTLGASRFSVVSFGELRSTIWPTRALILADRLMKQAGREWLRARLHVTQLGIMVDAAAFPRGIALRNGKVPPPRLGAVPAAIEGFVDKKLAALARLKQRIVRVAARVAGAPAPSAPVASAPPQPPAATPVTTPEAADETLPEPAVAALEAKLVETSDKMRAAGIDLIFLFDPHPNFPLYRALAERLETRDVGVAYWRRWPPEGFPDSYWNKEDSHWTELAIRETAHRIARTIQERGSLLPSRAIVTDHPKP